jgi:hypothetical protein
MALGSDVREILELEEKPVEFITKDALMNSSDKKVCSLNEKLNRRPSG